VLVLFSSPDQPVGHGNELLIVTPVSTELAWTPPPSGDSP
jgi:hypothetical protein